jgi:hypothetical protein
MKKLPKYFVIKREQGNHLWEKFINWLNERYVCMFSGNAYNYYGFDGGYDRNGTNAFNEISDFQNNPELITLEYWDECVNGIDYTIPGTKLPLIKDTIECRSVNWDEQIKNKNYYLNEEEFYSFGTKEYKGEVYVLAEREDYDGFNYWMFKLSDIKLAMEQEKEIIGYKPNYNIMDEMLDVVCQYECSANKIRQGKGYYCVEDNEYSIEEFKKYGVLDIWFTPVYKPKYSLPNINGYDGKINGTNVVYGNDSITISSDVEITIDQIKQIVEYYDNM